MVGVLPIDITQADDVLGLHFGEVGGPASSDADTEDVELVAWRDLLFFSFLGVFSPAMMMFGATAMPAATAVPVFRKERLDISLLISV